MRCRPAAGLEVGGGEEDEFVADAGELLLGVGVLDEAAADTGEGALQDGGDELGIVREGLRGGLEHGGDGAPAAVAHLAGDAGAVEVGADGVEGDAGAGVSHLRGQKGGDEGGGHAGKGLGGLFAADALDGLGDIVEVMAHGGLQEGALVGEVLVEGADRDAGARGDAGGGEALLADVAKNLNGGLEKGVDAGRGACLDGRFAGRERGRGSCGQMRTPNLKLSSSKHERTRAAAREKR